jgi:hypothetical protein
MDRRIYVMGLMVIYVSAAIVAFVLQGLLVPS